MANNDYTDAKARLNELYAAAKGVTWDGYTAPECMPQVQSDQVKALLALLVENGFRACVKASPPYQM